MIVFIIAVLLLLFLIALFIIYRMAFFCSKKNGSAENAVDLSLVGEAFYEDSRRFIDEISHRDCEFVRTVSYDGLTLVGRYYHYSDDAPLCICFHGYRGAAIRDFSGGGLYLMDEGYNVLLVDQRGQWRSGGRSMTFGIKERYDVLSWIAYADDRFQRAIPIYLFGISMGAATVLMSSGLDLPENVLAIIADCPYNSPRDIICYVIRQMKLPVRATWPLVVLSARLFGRFDPNAANAADAVKKTKKPILILHGEADRFVPPSMSEEVALANPAMVERHTFPNAAHGLSYLNDPERYRRLVREFMKSKLPE